MKRNIKLVFVLSTEMDDVAIEEFATESAEELKTHLMDTEYVQFTGWEDLSRLHPNEREALTELFEAGVESTRGEDTGPGAGTS